MSLVSIIFFLAGRLCCRANFIFAADLTLRGQLKLTCFRHIDYKCNYFLSFLFLTGFISDAMQFKHFLWLRFEDHGVYMMNLYWKEFAPLPGCRWERGCAPGWRSGGGGGTGGDTGAVNPREIWHFQVFKCQFAHSWISNMSQIPILGRTNTRSQDFMAALSISREQLLGEKWYPQTLCTSPSEQDIF